MATPSALILTLRETRNAVEMTLNAATHTANQLRVQLMIAETLEVFPDATTLVFTRDWDQDKPKLVQILTEEDELELEEKGFWEALSMDQRQALLGIGRIIELIGNDETLWCYMDQPSVESVDGAEFRLNLTAKDLSHV